MPRDAVSAHNLMSTRLQYMRKAPVSETRKGAGYQMPRDEENDDREEDYDVLGNDGFASTGAAKGANYKLLNDEERIAEQAAIDAAVANLLARRGHKGKAHEKAWGAPAISTENWQRSITRQRPATVRNRRRVSDSDDFDGDMMSPPSQARSSLAFVPERDANSRKVAWEETSPTRAGSNTSRSRRQQHDRRGRNADPDVPSNFSRKLKDMRDGAREEEEALREAYEDETKRGGPVRRPVSPRKNVEKYVSGVRDAFIRPETKRPSTAPEGRTRRVTSKPTTETKPFAGLEARATIQRKSTSFRKMEEDLRKKREAEEANLRYRFKPVPIPKSTREKRYQALVDKAEAIRIEGTAARKERLGDMIKPFEGMEMRDQERLEKKKRREEERKAAARRKKEDDDEAKRIQKIKKQRAAAAAMRAAEEHRAQEVLRRARMAKRAEDQLRHSKAPSRMAEFEKVKGQKAMEKARRAELKRAADERRRKAKSKVLGPGDIRASFEKKHARLKRRMQQGRMTKAPTRSKPFAFMSEDRMREEQERRKMHAQKLQQEEMEKREAARAPIVRMKMLAERSKKIRQPIPGQTKKSAAQEKLVKERLARRREEEEERKRDLKARQDKIKNASKEMQVVLRRRIEEEESRKGPTEDPRQRAANAKKDMEARLKRLRESIDKAVANRRYLFDQHKLDKRKQLARRKALETVGAAVFSSTDGDEDRDWKDAARKDKSGLFKDEEKEEMEIYDDDDDDYAKDDDFED